MLSDGDNVLPLATAQDHKRAFDGDRGPNTGGMGAISPAPVMTPELERRALEEIVLPTLAAMKAMGAPYKGVLYAGLMITARRAEAHRIQRALRRSRVPGADAAHDVGPRAGADRGARRRAQDFALRWFPDPAITVVMAANGYPGDYAKGSVIGGLDEAGKIDGVEIFHAGTRRDGGRILANGGRVLDVTASGTTLAEARARAYAAVDKIVWPEGFCRSDIGARAVEREKSGGEVPRSISPSRLPLIGPGQARP